MALDPISIGFGVANAGFGVLQSFANYQAQRQDYLNQTAFADANSEFASYQAGINKEVSDLNKQYAFWGQTLDYGQKMIHANSLRNVELMKAVSQAEVVRDTRAAAGASYVLDSEAIGQAYAEASMQDAVALQQYQWRSLQARASVQARGTAGKSVDRIVNNYARQEGDYKTIQSINSGLRGRQYDRNQTARIAKYLSQYNSQQYYQQADVFDPIAPFPPLPTMMLPPAPSMRGGGPSAGAAILSGAGAVLGGVNAAYGMQANINQITAPSPSPTPTPGGSN
jgi:hypothetical protein